MKLSLDVYDTLVAYDFSEQEFEIKLKIYDGCINPTFFQLSIIDTDLNVIPDLFTTIEFNSAAKYMYVPEVGNRNSITDSETDCLGTHYEFIYTNTVIEQIIMTNGTELTNNGYHFKYYSCCAS